MCQYIYDGVNEKNYLPSLSSPAPQTGMNDLQDFFHSIRSLGVRSMKLSSGEK